MKILQSIPYPTYTTAQRDALVGVLVNYKINNSDTGLVEEWNGIAWVSGVASVESADVLLTTVPSGSSATNQDQLNIEANGIYRKYNDTKSVIGGLNAFNLKFNRGISLTSIIVDATKITSILIGKNGATPSTPTYPYAIAAGDVLEFALTNVAETFTYLTLIGTYND